MTMTFDALMSRVGVVFVVLNWQFVIASSASKRPTVFTKKGRTSATEIPKATLSRNIRHANQTRDLPDRLGAQPYFDAWKIIMARVEHLDPLTPPNLQHDVATNVKVNMLILDFDDFNEDRMDYTLSFFLRLSWIDHRIAFEDLATKFEFDHLELNAPKIENSVWIPSLFFRNEKVSDRGSSHINHELMHVYPNGTVLYSTRMTVTLGCHMELAFFPFDHQICYVNLASFEYSTNFLQLHWDDIGIIYSKYMMLHTFEVKPPKISKCESTFDFSPDAEYSCLRANMMFSRNFAYYISSVYIPTTLFVILSWLSFWLNIDAVPARVTLGLLIVLTMTTQTSTKSMDLPHVSYIKAIDVWSGTCLVFVFAALIEFAYVNVNARIEDRQVEERLVARMDRRSDVEDRLMRQLSVEECEILPLLNGDSTGMQKSETSLHHSRQSKLSDSHGETQPMLTKDTWDITPHYTTRMDSEVDHDDIVYIVKRKKVHPNGNNPESEHVKNDGAPKDEAHHIIFEAVQPYDQSSETRRRNSSESNLGGCARYGKSPLGYLCYKATVGRTRAKQIDRMARMIFPLGFLVFNLIYWPFYLLMNKYSTDDMKSDMPGMQM